MPGSRSEALAPGHALRFVAGLLGLFAGVGLALLAFSALVLGRTRRSSRESRWALSQRSR